MDLLQRTASVPGGTGECNSCSARPPCLRAVGSATPAMHCQTTSGQWAMQLVQCTASLPRDGGQWNCGNALPHCLGAVAGASLAIHCLTAWGQWAVQLLQFTATPPGGSVQWNSAMREPTSWGDGESCAMRRSLPKERNSCNTLPQCLGTVGSGPPPTHCPTAWGQWAVHLLQCTASLLGGNGQCNSCNALPHCLGAVGSATPAMHCHTAWGRWPAELLQCAGGLGGPTQGAVAA